MSMRSSLHRLYRTSLLFPPQPRPYILVFEGFLTHELSFGVHKHLLPTVTIASSKMFSSEEKESLETSVVSSLVIFFRLQMWKSTRQKHSFGSDSWKKLAGSLEKRKAAETIHRMNICLWHEIRNGRNIPTWSCEVWWTAWWTHQQTHGDKRVAISVTRWQMAWNSVIEETGFAGFPQGNQPHWYHGSWVRVNW